MELTVKYHRQLRPMGKLVEIYTLELLITYFVYYHHSPQTVACISSAERES